MPDSQLIKSTSVSAFLRHHARIKELVDSARTALVEADRTAREAGFESDSRPWTALASLFDQPRPKCVQFLAAGGVERVMQEVDARAWQYLLRQSGVESFMTASALARWRQQIDARTFIPVSPEAVASTLSELRDRRLEYFEDGVIETFRSLSWDYKTNNPFLLEKRIILKGFARVDGRSISFYTEATSRVDDLARVLAVVDGNPMPDVRYGTMYACDKAHSDGLRTLEQPYYFLRWFKNGNAHLEFRRPDLVRGLNEIIARRFPGALPYARK